MEVLKLMEMAEAAWGKQEPNDDESLDECGKETICELLNLSDLMIIWRFGANHTCLLPTFVETLIISLQDSCLNSLGNLPPAKACRHGKP
jgi:hypothetical protein